MRYEFQQALIKNTYQRLVAIEIHPRVDFSYLAGTLLSSKLPVGPCHNPICIASSISINNDKSSVSLGINPTRQHPESYPVQYTDYFTSHNFAFATSITIWGSSPLAKPPLLSHLTELLSRHIRLRQTKWPPYPPLLLGSKSPEHFTHFLACLWNCASRFGESDSQTRPELSTSISLPAPTL